jgi:hypothetical protein
METPRSRDLLTQGCRDQEPNTEKLNGRSQKGENMTEGSNHSPKLQLLCSHLFLFSYFQESLFRYGLTNGNSFDHELADINPKRDED